MPEPRDLETVQRVLDNAYLRAQTNVERKAIQLAGDDLARLAAVVESARRLVFTWDDSADTLGPQWNGMGKRIDTLCDALRDLDASGEGEA